MSETTWAMLQGLLVDRYDDLRRRLARRLGSAELASETLHEAWLRLGRTGSPGVVGSPEAYVLRVALNAASDRRRSESRLLSASEIERLRHSDDNELDPERIAEARSEIVALKLAVDRLPPRCRTIFLLAKVEELSHRDIAERLGVSIRMIERELKFAFESLEMSLEKKVIKRVGSRALEPSSLEEESSFAASKNKSASERDGE